MGCFTVVEVEGIEVVVYGKGLGGECLGQRR